MKKLFQRFIKYFSFAQYKYFSNGSEKGFTLNKAEGFTLIELLVVISILGVLSAVTLPNVLGLMTAGNVSAANSEIATVQTAVDAYVSQSSPALTPSQIATIVVPGTPGVAAYLRGGDASIKGVYHVDSSGTVLITGVGTWTGVVASSGGHVWIKAP